MNYAFLSKYAVLFCVFLLPGVSAFVHAQSDNREIIREFVNLCNVHQKAPVQAELLLKNSTNMVRSTTDTATVSIFFQLQQSGSYMRYGELEQIGNDSLLLLVNPAAHKMLLYPNRSTISQRMMMLTALVGADSSIEKMADRYVGKRFKQGAGNALIGIYSRASVPEIQLPVEAVEAIYETASGRLKTITQVHRIVLPVHEAKYKELAAQPEYAGKLFKKGPSFFVVKERTAVYEYLHISFDTKAPLRVSVKDRVVNVGNRKYEPLPQYLDFILDQHL